MKLIKWPPEFDGIKIEKQAILVRIKNTDIWLELDLTNLAWLGEILSPDMHKVILAWTDLIT